MPIEIKELVVRAFVTSQPGDKKNQGEKITKTASETHEMQAEIIEQLKRMITDKKDR
ncbi:MAG: hypothetical protein HY064_03755 [Bacteroidetes bacterium]|nr:hypothetical protein [Bacteroidota bacterium]